MIKTTYETLLLEQQVGTLYITINRPKVLNALNQVVLTELQEVAQELSESSDAFRVVILQGGGDKAFVAGADIQEMSKMSRQQALEFSRKGQKLTRSLENLNQITIAKVQGFALGGGCELAMACDMIIASENAKFGQPEVSLGLIPGFGGTQRLAQRVGLSVAMDLVCTNRMIGGKEAYECGLVSRLAKNDQLNHEVEQVIKGILKSGPLALAQTKRLTRACAYLDLDAGLESEAAAFANCFSSAETKEGIAAFLDKRKASFCQ